MISVNNVYRQDYIFFNCQAIFFSGWTGLNQTEAPIRT